MAPLTTRERPEWISAHPDQAIPKIVKLRIWEREGGRCWLSGRKIMPGDAYEFEHVIAIANGGEHRERNIRLALKEPHRAKTSADAALTAKIRRQRLKHIGAFPPSKSKIRSRGFAPTRGSF